MGGCAPVPASGDEPSSAALCCRLADPDRAAEVRRAGREAERKRIEAIRADPEQWEAHLAERRARREENKGEIPPRATHRLANRDAINAAQGAWRAEHREKLHELLRTHPRAPTGARSRGVPGRRRWR